MTIGIYSLYWEEQDLIYIGLSINIEARFKEHEGSMRRNTHSNYKVQNAYTLYGLPIFNILEECSVDELPSKEIFWTKEFDSLNPLHGLNIIEAGGSGGFGTNASFSKYSRYKILKVFSLLYTGAYTYKQIQERCKVPNHLISNIKTGSSHLWLKTSYPEKYLLMVNNPVHPKTYQGIHGGSIVVISPEGDQYTISNIKDFCLSIDLKGTSLNSGMVGFSKLLSECRRTYKGWRLASYSGNITAYSTSRNSATVSKAVAPDGAIHEISNISEFCRDLLKNEDLAKVFAKGMSRMLNGTRQSYKGWKRYSSPNT